MVVLQIVDTWPFMMADTAKELPQEQIIVKGGGLAIPVIMISKKDSLGVSVEDDILIRNC